MKKLLKTPFLLLLIAFCILSCNEEDGDRTPALATFELLPNSQIITEQIGDNTVQRVVEGDRDVGVYRYVGAQSNITIDDEFTETLSFELPEGTNQFSLRDEELPMLKVFYRQSGAWPANFPDAEMKGAISGNLNVGSDPALWTVDIDIAMQRDGETYTTIQTNGVLMPQ